MAGAKPGVVEAGGGRERENHPPRDKRRAAKTRGTLYLFSLSALGAGRGSRSLQNHKEDSPSLTRFAQRPENRFPLRQSRTRPNARRDEHLSGAPCFRCCADRKLFTAAFGLTTATCVRSNTRFKGDFLFECIRFLVMFSIFCF